MKLIYVFDAYCGWSYGFAPVLAEIAVRHPDLPVEVVSGGLFTGERRAPIRRFGYVEGANAAITEVTGVRFGAAYYRLIADGSFVMDSEAAAAGMAALRQAAPERAVELAEAMQRAFYIEGRSLSDPATYRKIAAGAGLDGEAVAAAFLSPQAGEAAADDFRRARRLGAKAFPTLLAVNGTRTESLAVGRATADAIDQRLTALSTR